MIMAVAAESTTIGMAVLLAGAAASTPRLDPGGIPESRQADCTAPEFHQFDFWIGDWDTYDWNDPSHVTARNKVTSILGGCALREVYVGANGLVGESYNIYDASRHVWHQSWVTNRGQLLVLEGGLQGDRMLLSGTDPSPSGGPAQVRGVWRRVEGGVRETAETSGDGGATWTPWFDIVFRAHKQ